MDIQNLSATSSQQESTIRMPSHINNGCPDPPCALWEAQQSLLQHCRCASEVSVRLTTVHRSPCSSDGIIHFATATAAVANINPYRSGRNKKPMEVLGTYDPLPKEPPPSEGPDTGEKRLVKDIRLDTARTKYWLGVGAQPTEPVWKLLSIVGLLFSVTTTGATRPDKSIWGEREWLTHWATVRTSGTLISGRPVAETSTRSGRTTSSILGGERGTRRHYINSRRRWRRDSTPGVATMTLEGGHRRSVLHSL